MLIDPISAKSAFGDRRERQRKHRRENRRVRTAVAGFLGAAAAIGALIAPATAQLGAADYAKRQRDLVALAGVFGELHHIRRLCEPRRESEVWRERMKSLVNLESPTAKVRQNMVSAFNDGFRRAESQFRECRRSAEDYAAARAVDGEAIVLRLMAPLVAAEGDAGGINGESSALQ